MKAPDNPYQPALIEPKWQKLWEENKTFGVTEDSTRPKYYCLEMFPYPSGKIHMGHVRNYTIGDVIARYKRMCGFNVLHPIGYDAFGMPAENAAIENKIHPAVWTEQNMATMSAQLKRMGLSYDWSRELATCRPEYYRWEQLVFLKMLEQGLVYKKKSFVNWCERCQTVLANEQVVNGCCWRCDSAVGQQPLEQWFFKITAYASELLEGTKKLPGWPERVLTMQREWIGESEGALVRFPLEQGSERVIEIFTTRPDTLYGATFMSLAAEHPLVQELSSGTNQATEVKRFVEKVARMDRTKRLTEEYEKEGVFTGAYCLNPLNGRRMPIYAANFVLLEYGTGAVMAVPAHDQRDFEFAKKYQLPIVVVIQPPVGAEPLDPLTMQEAYVEPGIMTNSESFNGLPSEKMKTEVVRFLAEKKIGKKSTTYKLRDWGISRQRYWGTPIPILYCPNCGMVPVPESDLPVTLPTDVQFSGEGGSPLKKNKKFLETPCPKCKIGTAQRETDTMDTFVESSWYFLRYCSPQYAEGPFAAKAAQYWMPVDQYIGGIEHAVLHLLYARFFTKVLRDLGFFSMGKVEENLPPLPLGERAGVRGGPLSEPFVNLLTQGMVIKDGAKMSKSKGNVVDPNYLIEKYGADTARLFSLFAAPPEKDLEWNDQGVEGMYRFLGRVWRLITELIGQNFLTAGKDKTDLDNLKKKLNQTIKKVTDDLEKFHFNTAIATLMELLNFLNDYRQQSAKTLTDSVVPPSVNDQKNFLKDTVQDFVKMLAPLVPHVAEELWRQLGKTSLVLDEKWPRHDESALKEESVTLVVQVGGVMRTTLSVPVGLTEAVAVAQARGDEKVQRHLEKKTLVKTIYIPNRLLNFVVK